MSSVFDAVFAHALDKARYIDGAAREEASDPAVRAFAIAVLLCVRLDEFARRPPLDALRALHRAVRDGIRFERDIDPRTGERCELLDSAATVLRRRRADCDGKSRLFVAAALAIGEMLGVDLEARIVAVCPDDDEDFEHVQAETRIGGGPWIRVELTLAGVELGAGVEAARFTDAGDPIYA